MEISLDASSQKRDGMLLRLLGKPLGNSSTLSSPGNDPTDDGTDDGTQDGQENRGQNGWHGWLLWALLILTFNGCTSKVDLAPEGEAHFLDLRRRVGV